MEEINTDLKTKRLKDCKLALFFSYGVSLELWWKRGMLARELKLYQELGKHFGKIYFLTYGRNDFKFAEELKKDNIEILPKKFWCPNFVYSFILSLVYRPALRQCDFYKTNQLSGSWSAVVARWLYGKKLIVRTGYTLSIFVRRASWLKYWLAGIIEKLALRAADIFVVATVGEKEYFRKFSHKITVIPNYVDTDLFKPIPELKNKEDKTILLFIGRLNQQKNLENLILALEHLDNIRLQIIGSGELQDKLKKLAEEKKVAVEFLGNQPYQELPKYINAADIFVLPSLYEGNPKVLLEALACGAVVLGANVRGINSLITEGVNGFLAQPDALSLQGRLREILFATSQDKLFEVKKTARAFAAGAYSWEVVLKKELANYA